jgi:hypothetical protein
VKRPRLSGLMKRKIFLKDKEIRKQINGKCNNMGSTKVIKGKVISVLNYVIKHYAMKACGGVDL